MMSVQNATRIVDGDVAVNPGIDTAASRSTWKAGDGIRTHDVQLGKLALPALNAGENKAFSKRAPIGAPKLPESDPELDAIVSAWPTLPGHVRLAIVALAGTKV